MDLIAVERRKDSPEIGQRVARFRLLECIGRGGMAGVYRAEDAGLRRYVALKLLDAESAGIPAVRIEQFLREARAMASVDHPNVVQVYEVGQFGRRYFIAMELVEGGTVEDGAIAAERVSIRQACMLAADAAEGLACAHEHGVVHGDVNPANLLITRDGRCKVTDFGLAWIDSPKEYSHTTLAGGAPGYTALEILRGGVATPASDIFGLACTFYRILAGSPPPGLYALRVNSGSDGAGWLSSAISILRRQRPDISAGLSDLIAKAMDPSPSARLKNMHDFAKSLRFHAIECRADSLAIPQQITDQRQSQPGFNQWLMVSAIIVIGIVIAEWLSNRFSTYYGGPRFSPISHIANNDSPPHQTPHNSAVVSQNHLANCSLTEPVQKPVSLLTIHSIAELRKLAAQPDGRIYAFRGSVLSCGISSSKRVFQIFFNDPAQPLFRCVYFPELYHAMGARFGGQYGSGLIGKTITITGVVKLHLGVPEIVVDDPSQVAIEQH